MSPRFHTFCENFHVTCKYLIALPIKIHQVNCYFIQSPKWLTLSEWQWNWYNHTMSLNGKYSHRIALFILRHFLRIEMNHSIHCIEKWNEMKWCHIFNQYLPVVCWTQTKRQFFSLSLSLLSVVIAVVDEMWREKWSENILVLFTLYFQTKSIVFALNLTQRTYGETKPNEEEHEKICSYFCATLCYFYLHAPK